jgi:ribosomal-protein-alanine N-acetyltransferase
MATAAFKEQVPGQAAAGPVPAGLVLARVVAADCEILTLGVAPPWRRRGVARRLLSAALAESRRAGARAVFLEVAEDNPAAQAFYRAEGFTRVGLRADYYRRPGAAPVAALVLSCRLEALKP